MAKGAWIGVGGKAKKIKSMYIGVDGKAKRVKKAWIGVGGKAKLFYSSDVSLAYKGAATALTAGSYTNYGTQTSTHAFFANEGKYPDAYNASLTKTKLAAVTEGNNTVSFAVTGNSKYAFIGGGRSTWSDDRSDEYYNTLDTYNTSLTKSTTLSVVTSMGGYAVGTFKDFAVISGGKTSSNKAYTYTYNTSLTRTGRTNLGSARYYAEIATNDSYCLVGGGRTASSSYSSYVDAYNSSWTRSTPTSLTTAVEYHGHFGNSEYAFFAGGKNRSIQSTINIYNKSLTKSTATLPTTCAYSMSVSLDDMGIIMGGSAQGDSYYTKGSKSVYGYDNSLTRHTMTSLPEGRTRGATAKVGGHILVAGGYIGEYTKDSEGTKQYYLSKTVRAFTY